jgi:hypothetical protein
MTALMSSLLALLENKTEEAIKLMKAANTTREPEILLYFARHYSRLKKPDLAITALKQAAQSGFVCAPHTLTSDPWFSPLQRHPEFNALRHSMQTLVNEARSSFDRSTV